MTEATTGEDVRDDRISSRRRNYPGPRKRLLASATTLFTTESTRVVGIDRILREADVVKAGLYSLFGSENKLVITYLQDLDAKWWEAWEQRVTSLNTPAEETLASLDQCTTEQSTIDFRGSRFQNATNEYPWPETELEQNIRQAAADYRSWVW